MTDAICCTPATPAHTPQLMRLWQQVFGDTQAYIQNFFTHRYEQCAAMVALCGERVVAMQLLLPVELWSGGQRQAARYIYAVATHPDFRSRGIGRTLMQATHAQLRAQGIAASLLVPAEPSLFDYYRTQGFETAFCCHEMLWTLPSDPPAPVALTPAELQTLLPLRDAVFGESALYVRWDADALRYQQRELLLQGGETLRFTYQNAPGYAVCLPAGEQVRIKEWCGPAIAPAVLASIAARYGVKTLWLRLASDAAPQEARPFGMICRYLPERKKETGSAPYLSLVLD